MFLRALFLPLLATQEWGEEHPTRLLSPALSSIRWRRGSLFDSSRAVLDFGATWIGREAGTPFPHDQLLRPNLRLARPLGGWIFPGGLAAVGLGRRVSLLDHRRFRTALRDYHSDRAQNDRTNPKSVWPKPGGSSVD